MAEEQPYQGSRTGKITSMTELSHPVTATSRNGRLVKLIALGDIEGFSPSCLVVNNEGELDWESINKFTVVDAQFLPPDAQAYFGITANQGIAQGSQRSGKY